MPRSLLSKAVVVLLFLLAPALAAQQLPEDWLVIGSVGRGGRSVVHTDAIEHAIVTGGWRAPKAGQTVELSGGKKVEWKPATLSEGRIAIPRGGYAWCHVESKEHSWAELRALGHALVYVNGELRMGDFYRLGYSVLPIAIPKGGVDLLFRAGRGDLRVSLESLERPAFFTKKDSTMPDVLVDAAPEDYVGAVCVAAVAEKELHVRSFGDAFEIVQRVMPSIPRSGVRKIPVVFRPKAGLRPGKHELRVQLRRKHPRGDAVLHEHRVVIHARSSDALHKRSFVSRVDGSVQYYAVRPATGKVLGPKGLFLSLHGASVEAWNQAASYSSKSWGHIVAPTNRRPFGFDWEFIGRLDALEVLAHAQRVLSVDPSMIYLTGHSMGGHGTWHIGGMHPDTFAAIAPSAGWSSFASYSRRRAAPESSTGPVEELLQRASNASNTLLRKHNYAQQAVYVLHGDADKNVPVREARLMRTELEEWHRDLQWHEQPGAGHWWDRGGDRGADCVDWAPIFDLFARRRVPASAELRVVDFTTTNPAESSRCHWLRILAQRVRLAASRVQLRMDPARGGFEGSTQNVQRMELDTRGLSTSRAVRLSIDGDEFDAVPDASGRIHLEQRYGEWTATRAPRALMSPQQSGPFSRVFDHRVVFVYGTAGSKAENAWSFAKARYDAEQLLYRGNGAVDLIADRDFDPVRFGGRNVLLFGNAKTNTRWSELLGDEVEVGDGRLALGSSSMFAGAELACILVRPRPGSSKNLVGGVGGTGIVGMRLCDRMPYFVSGVHFPDVFVAKPEMLKSGVRGVLAAGFFGHDWSVEGGDFVYR